MLTNGYSRFSHMEDGACIIGIEQRALVIPVAFDVFVSVRVGQLPVPTPFRETCRLTFSPDISQRPLHHTPHEEDVECSVCAQRQNHVSGNPSHEVASC